VTALGTPDSAFVPDLTLWHRWHFTHGTLPEAWKGMGIPEISRELGVPAWVVARPWRLELDGASAETTEKGTERVTRWTAGSRMLQSKWVLGPDGDWWLAEYPVKSADDLDAALAVVEARRYAIDDATLAAARSAAGPDDLLALELPMRPYSELFHNFLGWTEGLIILLEQPEAVQRLLDALEHLLQNLVERVAAAPAALVLSPDNLDGSFIPSAAFEKHLAPGYHRTCDALHAAGKRLVVHAGGMCRGLLPGLAGAGVDAVEGVCGAPQSDASIAEARTRCGPGMTLWGGVAQDLLLSATGGDVFERGAREALAETRANGPAVLGVADRVPVGAAPERLATLARMARDG
jgi:hypothetical protein